MVRISTNQVRSANKAAAPRRRIIAIDRIFPLYIRCPIYILGLASPTLGEKEDETEMAKMHVVRRGALFGEGATKAEARAALDRQIDWACDHRAATIECRFGLLIIVAADSAGWVHTIVDPAELEHGKQKHSSCHHGQAEIANVLDSARAHAAQWAWSPSVDDDSAFIAMAGLRPDRASQMRAWIAFQRNYLAGCAMRVDIFAADTGILERLSVPLPEALGNDSHAIAAVMADIALHGHAIVGGGAAPAFRLIRA